MSEQVWIEGCLYGRQLSLRLIREELRVMTEIEDVRNLVDQMFLAIEQDKQMHSERLGVELNI